jgi:hypothetical protein
MTTPVFAQLLIGTVLVVYLGIGLAIWIRLRGTRLVTCPETQTDAAVGVDVAQAIVATIRDNSDLRVAGCSRWPQRHDCDQACVPQIAERGGEAKPRTIAAHFFENQRCAICRYPIDPIPAAGLQPGLLDPVTHEATPWHTIRPEQLPHAFQSHRALCARCTVEETPNSFLSGMLPHDASRR